MRITIPALLLLAACDSQPPPDAGNPRTAEVPEPSGPPVAPQIDDTVRSLPAEATSWESTVGSEGMSLRLVRPGGALVMSLACRRSPARLVAAVPAFTPIGSEERFSLGLGEEAVTLVADLANRNRPGVTGEGAVPSEIESLLESAAQLSASYGNQTSGPHAAPQAELKEQFAKACKAESG